MALIHFLRKNTISRNIIYHTALSRTKKLVAQFEPHLKKTDKILDIGSGLCTVCEVLRKKKYNVAPLDIQNLSFVDDIKPLLYDGNKIPFKNNAFDVSLVLTILHHTPNPEKILKEAKRVSKKIIVIEDIYHNVFHKYLTYFFDSLLNLEFAGHPHMNKDDKGWKRTFKKLDLKVVEVKYQRVFFIFDLAIYYLKK